MNFPNKIFKDCGVSKNFASRFPFSTTRFRAMNKIHLYVNVTALINPFMCHTSNLRRIMQRIKTKHAIISSRSTLSLFPNAHCAASLFIKLFIWNIIILMTRWHAQCEGMIYTLHCCWSCKLLKAYVWLFHWQPRVAPCMTLIRIRSTLD